MTSSDMRKLINLFEARTPTADISYALAGTTKGKTAAGDFSKITATVTGRTSEKFTKLAQKFNRIDLLSKEMNALREDVNQEAKDHIEGLFAAEDEVYTRYIDTVSLAITMSKSIESSETTVTDVDLEKFVGELVTVVSADLLPVIEALLAKHTTINKKIRAAQQGRLSITIPAVTEDDASGTPSIWNRVAEVSKSIYDAINNRMRRYDSKLFAIKARYAHLA
jgi:uncharacterized protein YdcH (DUF465 family)